MERVKRCIHEDINEVHGGDGLTPLGIAEKCGHRDVVDILLTAGARIESAWLSQLRSDWGTSSHNRVKDRDMRTRGLKNLLQTKTLTPCLETRWAQRWVLICKLQPAIISPWHST